MKNSCFILIIFVVSLSACHKKTAQTEASADSLKTGTSAAANQPKHLYLDVHNLGKVKFADVAAAHQKDLATQDKFGVSFIKYWVDEAAGKVYCLAESPDSASLSETHKAAHGLIPDRVELVTNGIEASIIGKQNLYLDIHKIGPGKVTAEAVADAHAHDLATQGKYNVRFINYWVDEKDGVVTCLSEASDTTDIIKTHKEAHGLLPTEIHEVKQGQ